MTEETNQQKLFNQKNTEERGVLKMNKILPIPDAPSKPSPAQLSLAGQTHQADSEKAEVYPYDKYYPAIYIWLEA